CLITGKETFYIRIFPISLQYRHLYFPFTTAGFSVNHRPKLFSFIGLPIIFPIHTSQFSDRFYGLWTLQFRDLFKLVRSEEHTSELQSRFALVCRLLLEKKNGARTQPSASAARSCTALAPRLSPPSLHDALPILFSLHHGRIQR